MRGNTIRFDNDNNGETDQDDWQVMMTWLANWLIIDIWWPGWCHESNRSYYACNTNYVYIIYSNFCNWLWNEINLLSWGSTLSPAEDYYKPVYLPW